MITTTSQSVRITVGTSDVTAATTQVPTTAAIHHIIIAVRGATTVVRQRFINDGRN